MDVMSATGHNIQMQQLSNANSDQTKWEGSRERKATQASPKIASLPMVVAEKKSNLAFPTRQIELRIAQQLSTGEARAD